MNGYAPTRTTFTDREPPRLGQGPNGGTRPFTGSSNVAPPHRTLDHRYARPSHLHVVTHPQAHYVVPVHVAYRPYYTRWYVHPYYRWCYSTTVVVGFGFATYAWVDWWTPPVRYGWAWVPGYWSWGWWHPGYWAPTAPPPPSYAYVPGWWEYEDVYVEGYYRVSERDGWEWVDGYYLDDGTYVRGHWVPTDSGPEGYVWEPGFYDGDTYIDGFWRPEFRSTYQWISAYYDADGVFHSGYWQPTQDRPGHVWVPGWFDGNEWIEGYWVLEEEYRGTDPNDWEPEEGYDEGWDREAPVDRAPQRGGEQPRAKQPGAEAPTDRPAEDGDGERWIDQEELPLALPVSPPEPVEE